MNTSDSLAITQLIDDVRAGRIPLAEATAGLDAESAGLVTLAATIVRPDVQPDPAFRIRARAELLAAISVQDAPPVTTSAPSRLWRVITGGFPPAMRRPRMVWVTSLVIVLALTLGSGGAALTAQGALPGDPLYPVKTATESVGLALAGSEPAQLDARLWLTERRLQEAEAALAAGRTDSASDALAQYATQLQSVAPAGDEDTLRIRQSLEAQERTLDRLRVSYPAGAADFDAALAAAIEANRGAGPGPRPGGPSATPHPSGTPGAAPSPSCTPAPQATGTPIQSRDRDQDRLGATRTPQPNHTPQATPAPGLSQTPAMTPPAQPSRTQSPATPQAQQTQTRDRDHQPTTTPAAGQPTTVGQTPQRGPASVTPAPATGTPVRQQAGPTSTPVRQQTGPTAQPTGQPPATSGPQQQPPATSGPQQQPPATSGPQQQPGGTGGRR